MSAQLEVRFSVSTPDGILAAEYIADKEEIVAVGVGFCGVRVPAVLLSAISLSWTARPRAETFSLIRDNIDG